jgi:tetratricopeptide (TPR) repeat protein
MGRRKRRSKRTSQPAVASPGQPRAPARGSRPWLLVVAVGIATATALLAVIGFRRHRESVERLTEIHQPPQAYQADNLGQSAVSTPTASRASPPIPRPAGALHGYTGVLDPSPAPSETKTGRQSPSPPPQPPSRPSEPASVATASVQPATQALLNEEYEVARRLAIDFPDKAFPLCLLGDTCKAQGNSTEAAKYWEACLKLDPRFAVAHYRLGVLALTKTDYEEAVRRCRAAVKIDPTIPGVHGGLARALMFLGKPDEAIPELEQELRVTPKVYLDLVILGQAYLQLNACDKAMQRYEEATQLQPNDWHAYYGLADVCEKRGESERAERYREAFQRLKSAELEDFYRGLKEHDDQAAVAQRVSETYCRAGRAYCEVGNLRQAEEHWRRAAAIAAKDTACRLELAAFYQRTGQDQAALRTYGELQEIDPACAGYAFNAGVAAARLQRFDAAETAFRKAIQLAPRQADAYGALAALYLKTGQKLGEARTLAETAVRLEPSAANLTRAAEAYDKNGELDKARSSLQRAIALDPDNERYQRLYELLKQRK